MRVRHRIPSIFSLSMVDVLCCALGCVILLWLLNLRDAKQQEENASEKLKETTTSLVQYQGDVKKKNHEIEILDKERADLLKQKTDLRFKARELETKVEVVNERLVSLTRDLAARDETVASINEQLKEKNDKIKTLTASADLIPGLKNELKEAKERLQAEQAKLVESGKSLEMVKNAQSEMAKSLDKSKSNQGELAKTLEMREKELENLRGLKDQFAMMTERMGALEKQLADKNRDLTLAAEASLAIQEEKKIWQAEANRARTAVDNRFAGIQLSGRRAIFLVDMSGSMDLVDEKTPAPTKWNDVTNSVGKVMRSLPELQKFQVIVFSLKTSYLFPGTENTWIDYDPRTSPDRVVKALNQIKPKDGTNMFSAMETAFKFRELGLDTLYVFSDGLPNMGVGVTNEEANKLTELQLGERLGKHIRRTLQTNWNSTVGNRPRVKINTVGFFYESPDVGAFLWALARENEGSFVGMSKP